MSSELNEKIFDLLDEKIHLASTSAMYQMREAANSIEQLILNIDIELLKKLQSDKFVYETIGITISDLTQQLNKLKEG